MTSSIQWIAPGLLGIWVAVVVILRVLKMIGYRLEITGHWEGDAPIGRRDPEWEYKTWTATIPPDVLIMGFVAVGCAALLLIAWISGVAS